MQILSQNDPRWKNIKLGFSNTTIGNYGCTITCIAMIVGVTPDVVNQRLKDVNGFAEGNLVIWAKIEEAFPGIKVRRVWTYDNADVKKSLPCLVEVDGKPIGGFRHWVVYTGNQKCYDPWDGKEDPTSDYPNPTSYCVISGEWIKPVTKKIEEPIVQDDPNKINLYDAFRRAYKALTGEWVKQEEIDPWMKKGISLDDAMTEIMKGDGRFYKLWIEPELQQQEDQYEKEIVKLMHDVEKAKKDLADYIAQQKLKPNETVEIATETYPESPKNPPVSIDPVFSGPLVNLLQFLKKKLGF